MSRGPRMTSDNTEIDHVDQMIKEIREHRDPDLPLGLTALEVAERNWDSLTEVESLALAHTGYVAVESEGGAWPVFPGSSRTSWPQSCPPSVEELIRTRIPADDINWNSLSSEDVAALAIVGFITIVGEHFRQLDAAN